MHYHLLKVPWSNLIWLCEKVSILSVTIPLGVGVKVDPGGVPQQAGQTEEFLILPFNSSAAGRPGTPQHERSWEQRQYIVHTLVPTVEHSLFCGFP